MFEQKATTATSDPIDSDSTQSDFADLLSQQLNCEFQCLAIDEIIEAHFDEFALLSQLGLKGVARDIPESLLQLIFKASQSNQTEFVQIPNSSTKSLLVVPFDDSVGRSWVAIGIPEIKQTQLIQAISNLSLQQIQNQTQLSQQTSHIRLFSEQVTNSMEELTWLRSLSSHLKISRSDNRLEQVVEHTFESLCTAIQAEALLLIRPKKEGFSPERRRQENLNVAVWNGCREYGEEACLRLAEEVLIRLGDRPYVWNRSSRVRKTNSVSIDECFHSCILVPIRSNSQDFGWIVAINKIPPMSHFSLNNGGCPTTLGLNEFGTIEASLLESASGMLATHAANISLFSEQQHLTVSIIRSLIKVVDARDRYTCGHSDRVAVMARELARCIGFEPSEVESICLAGLLHDIGKVGVPDEILLKPGRLSREEFEVIKEHPERGVEILKHIQQLHHILPGVLHHHEAFDGSGYPDGLEGTDIPEMARVIAIVDAYDAITTSRPYREARSHEEAIAILKAGAGKGWDPDYVQVFMNQLDRIVHHSHDWEEHISRVLDPAISAFDALAYAGAYSTKSNQFAIAHQ